jgi:glucose-6-phosphate 1-dehydrogenase
VSSVEPPPVAGRENPLRDAFRMRRVPGPCSLVIFGGLGDLAGRKLVPALYNLYLRRLLPAGFAVIGTGRTDPGGDDGYRAELRRRCEAFSRTPVTAAEWAGFADLLCWVTGTFDDAVLYRSIGERLARIDAERATGGNVLFYLSVPPSQFPVIVDGLGDARLANQQDGWRRAVIEKPFGHDLGSSAALNQEIHRAFDESQIFRIDHYLGKETVQNILVFRFANGIFEPVWNRNFIDHVQITVAESIGVEGRGRFYEEAGALRDIVQNHMLQVLSFVAMEPPASFAAEAVRDERGKVLQAARPLRPGDVVRGQYAGGFVDGAPATAYRDEVGVAAASDVETYVAARLRIDNWRWADTPFYLRTGKRLPKRVTEVAIQFKRVPHLPFSYAAAEQLEPNVLVLRIQPNEGIALRFGAKVPSERVQIRTVTMDFDYDTAFSAAPAEAYETLLVDAMRGDGTNFPRHDAVEQSWRIVEPLLDSWARLGGGPHPYEAGNWGPEAADELIAQDRRRWRRP